MLRGVESGGAVSGMGRACAFVAEDGSSLPWLQSVHSIAVNGRHAILLAESMVRIEMLRTSRNQTPSLWLRFYETARNPIDSYVFLCSVFW